MNGIYIISAMDLNNGIGLNGDLPWGKIPEDMTFFMKMTRGNTIVMGRKTWNSIGSKPLKNRKNVILTKDKNFKTNYPEVDIIHDPIEAHRYDGKIFIIGGSQVYNQFIDDCDGMFLTIVNDEFDCDTWFPEFDIDTNFRKSYERKISSRAGYDIVFTLLQRRLGSEKAIEKRFLDFEFYYINRR